LPNVGIVYIKKGREKSRLTRTFKEAEAKAGIKNLPLIIFSPKGEMQLEDQVMAQRSCVKLPIPVVIPRIIEAVNSILSPSLLE